MCPRGLDGMHTRKCNATAGRRKKGEGGKEAEGWGAQFFTCEMLAKLEKGRADKII